jgi:transcriptional regulator CtsR
MLFTKPLYDKIFRELAENQEHTIQTLHKAIYKKEKISLPNFYKIIETLLTNQILTKEQ